MAAVFPGGAPNTYVPGTDATGNLTVDYSRNVDSFPLNRWLQIIPVNKTVGLYTKMTIEQAGRVLDTTGNDKEWADGDDAPAGRGNGESFQFLSYLTHRRAFANRIGSKAAAEGQFDVLAWYMRLLAQQAMTLRAQIALTLAQTSGNWSASQTSAVGSISGVTGKWDVSTTARQDIKRSIDYALDQIRLQTLGAVNLEDFKLVMSPGCARKMAVSQEIVDYIKGSPDALDRIKGNIGRLAQYGLPDNLYGIELVVEDTVKVTSRKGATRAASYVCDDTKPFIVARKGSLVAPENSNAAPNFSTIVAFMLEEMTSESDFDKKNRVHKNQVTDDYDMKLISDISGFLFTSAVAS